MNIQFIEHNGQRQYAIVPAELYVELVEKTEIRDNIKAFDAFLVQDEKLITKLMLLKKSITGISLDLQFG